MILKRIADSETVETVGVVNTVLKWMLCAQESWTLQSINTALAIGVAASDEFRWKQTAVLDMCQNLLVYDKQLEIFRFTHYSVQEFLVGQPGFDQEKVHAGFAEMCLSVITCQSDTAKSVLLRYCTFSWAAHVRLAGGGTGELERLWKLFLQPSPAYRAWCSRVKTDWRQRSVMEEYNLASPLWVAYFYRLYSIFEFLLGNGANGNDPNDRGESPLVHAARVGDIDFVERMVKSQNVDLNYRRNDGLTALSLAVEEGHERVVRIILEKDGVDPNSKDNKGRTPLSMAAICGREVVVQMLLEKDGVDPDSKSNDGRTPLSWAAQSGCEKVIQILLEEGVDPDSTDNDGRTPLSMAAIYGNEVVVQMLLAKDGVNPNSKDYNHQTPLSLAAWNGHEVVVQMLLEKDGVNPNSKDNNRQTPLSLAAQFGRGVVVQMLLGKDGVDPDSTDNDGRTPLSWAAGKDRYSRRASPRVGKAGFQILLQKEGVNPNSRDGNGRTPLWWAACCGRQDIVQVLLNKKGVDPDSKDNKGSCCGVWPCGRGPNATEGASEPRFRRRLWSNTAVMGWLG